jgi:hypothetical protein
MTGMKIRINEVDEYTLFTEKTLSFGNTSLKTPYKNFDLNSAPLVSSLRELNKDVMKAVNIVEKSTFIGVDAY